MEEPLKAPNKAIKQEALLIACIGHFSEIIAKEKFPPAITQEFGDGLKEATMPMLNCQKPNTNPFPLMGMMLETHIKAVSGIIVAMAALDPLHLQSIGAVSKEEQDLLQRGLEDHIIELSTFMLKKHILNDHLNFAEFMKKEEEKLCPSGNS